MSNTIQQCPLCGWDAFLSAPEVAHMKQVMEDSELGFIVRSGDWNAESWLAAAEKCSGRGLLGLADMCRAIGLELGREEGQ